MVGLDDAAGDLRRRAGPRCAPRPTTWPATTRCTRPTSTPATACPGRGRPRRACPRSPGCRWPRATATGDGRVRRPGGARDGQRHRGAAAPRRRLACPRPRSPGWPRCSPRLRPRPPRRRTSRHQRWHRGTVDAPRTLRASLRHMGEPAEIAWRRRGNKPRRVVLLVDVSGSMSGYADALLRLAHRITQRRGRRGRDVHGRHPAHPRHPGAARQGRRAGAGRGRRDRARLVGRHPARRDAADLPRPLGPARPGAGRGRRGVQRRLGARRPGAARRADGPAAPVAHRVVWVNPHRGKHGYEPVQQGVVAVLPHVDDFVAGHSLATYAELVEVVARA